MKQKKVAVILAGCGVFDGAEIQETVFSLLSIEKDGAAYEVYAPDIEQKHVINHITGQEMSEKRNVLTEAARITRGKIQPLTKLKTSNFDALILPGGFGVAKNLCTFAFDGADCKVNPEVESVVKEFHKAKKPIGALCISPVLLTKIIGNTKVTIGNDPDASQAVEKMGGTHITTTHAEVVIDKENKIATTPCYMLDATISQIAEGADKVVKETLELILDTPLDESIER
ncbi:isoprenoid biosynthesis glyoxalase ElbB [Marinilabiliaceae bacterium ANBcel2]|nr:isoprenoid biosynthesis glyoxalase ElbB [Marinilabiliaceae bacterium ANBcel2]